LPTPLAIYVRCMPRVFDTPRADDFLRPAYHSLWPPGRAPPLHHLNIVNAL
jgi:hypothetical protein